MSTSVEASQMVLFGFKDGVLRASYNTVRSTKLQAKKQLLDMHDGEQEHNQSDHDAVRESRATIRIHVLMLQHNLHKSEPSPHSWFWGRGNKKSSRNVNPLGHGSPPPSNSTVK